MQRREPFAATLLLLAAFAVSACGGSVSSEAPGRPSSPDDDRRRAERAAATFARLYFNPLAHGTADARDLERLRTVTVAKVYEELAAKHRDAARERRQSAYARRALNRLAHCDVARAAITPRSDARVLAEPAIRCAGGPVGWGYELVRSADGRWVVASLRDARFDSEGRCIAETCRP